MPWEDDVRLSGDVQRMQAVPHAKGEQSLTKFDLGARVLASDARHQRAPGFARQNVLAARGEGHQTAAACGSRSASRRPAAADSAARIASASALAISGGTAFPICRKAGFIVPQNVNPSGND